MAPFEHVPFPVSEVVQKVAVGEDDTPHERATGMHARRGITPLEVQISLNNQFHACKYLQACAQYNNRKVSLDPKCLGKELSWSGRVLHLLHAHSHDATFKVKS